MMNTSMLGNLQDSLHVLQHANAWNTRRADPATATGAELLTSSSDSILGAGRTTMDTTPYTLAHLSPLIMEITKLSWDNLVETHSRWSEEVSSLCALAGNGVFASLQIPPSTSLPNNTSQKKTNRKNKKHNNKKNQNKRMTTSFTEHDDHIAKSIIILCMTRDIRDRFTKFMKVATTSKKLFNGIAILKAAVAEGQAREREAGNGIVPESILHIIRMKALAMAEEIDWKSTTSSTSDEKRGVSFLRIKRWKWLTRRNNGEN